MEELSPNGQIRLETLMQLFYEQFWTFSDFLNDTKGKVPTWKYADYVLYALKKTLDKNYPECKDFSKWPENEMDKD